MAQNLPGRHRAPGRFNPLAELGLIAKESAQPAVKGAAIVAASGGLVATTFASPASAAEGSGNVVAAAAHAVSAPAAAGPASGPVRIGTALNTIGFAAPAVKAAPKAAKAANCNATLDRSRASSPTRTRRKSSAHARIASTSRPIEPTIASVAEPTKLSPIHFREPGAATCASTAN